jgi:BolA family transcriptional regulator, general stress-responsive regulator
MERIEAKSGLEQLLRHRLEKAFSPTLLRIENKSHLHQGHLPAEESTGETHFAVTLEAEMLRPLSRLERHRRVHAVLEDLFETRGLHALSLFL